MRTRTKDLENQVRSINNTQETVCMSDDVEAAILHRFNKWAASRVSRGTWMENTAKARGQAVQRLTRFAKNGSKARFCIDETGKLRADNFDVEEAERLQDDMLNHGNSPTTVNITTRYLAEMAESRKRGTGWIDDDLAQTFRHVEQLPTRTTAERAILSQEEGTQMVRETTLCLEGQGICLLSHGAGLRRSSIAGILRGDVFLDELEDGTAIVTLFIRAEIAKGNREYWTFVFGFADDFLRWLRKRDEAFGSDPTAPLIPHRWKGRIEPYTHWSIYEVYKKMLRKVLGIDAAKKHSLQDARRWAGTNFYFMTNDIVETARFMGHAKKDGTPNIKQTVQYVNVATTWGKLRRSKYATIRM